MKGLLKYLSPFAPDQSGAVAVFYELGGITVVCDAGGCTGNICGFDEPRWFQGKSALFSAGLRDMDAILGRDDKLVEKLKGAATRLDGKFAVIIGTPVPAVIATDFRALKRMASKRCGIPVMTVACTGTRLYDEGEEEAYLELFRTFTEKDTGTQGNDFSHLKNAICRNDAAVDGESKEVSEQMGKKEKFCDAGTFMQNEQVNDDVGNLGKMAEGAVGVIGMTPLDTSDLRANEILEKQLRAQGADEVYCYGMGAELDAVKKAGTVTKNLVVSPAGVKAAKYLQETFGTPYEPAFPFLKEDFKEKLHTLSGKKVLIIHQQVAANAIRAEIRRGEMGRIIEIKSCDVLSENGIFNQDRKTVNKTGCEDVTNEWKRNVSTGMKENSRNEIICGTWFLQVPEWTEPQDVHFEREEQFISYVEQEKFDVIIGDRIFQRALGGWNGEFIHIPHFAVSGLLFTDVGI